MPPEIADSDAESDIEDRPPLSRVIVETKCLEDEIDPLNINFDEFLSRSENISQTPSIQRDASKRSTGSTERLLRGIDTAQHVLAGSNPSKSSSELPADLRSSDSPIAESRKRRHSVIIGSENLHPTERNGGGARLKKRAKTYESSRGRLSSSQSAKSASEFDSRIALRGLDGSAAMSRSGASPVEHQNAAQELNSTMLPPTMIMTADDDNEKVVPRQRDRPRKAASLLNENVNGPNGSISTARSSMGGYESINIDLRGSLNGLEVNANPFGNLSQISVDGEVDTAETQRLASIFLNKSTLADHFLQTQDHLRHDTVADGSHMQTPGRLRSRSIDPSLLMHDLPDNLPNDTQLLSSSTKASMRETSKTHHKGYFSDRSVSYGGNCDQDAVITDSELVNGASMGKKRGCKGNNQSQLSTPPSKQLTSELNLSDEAFIGLPKENYRPRSSRSRQGTDDRVDTEASAVLEYEICAKSRHSTDTGNGMAKLTSKIGQGLPVNTPTSEVHLNDEAAIGLPPENYKPRPSRSRSKRVLDEEDIAPVQPQEDSRSRSTENIDAPPTQSPPKTQKKRGRKAKVKRAKTSAAAMLKKSEPMLSDGEEDVIFMDEKPAKVKLDLPPDVKIGKAVKDEDKAELAPTGKAAFEVEDSHGPSTSNTFSIQIPPPLEPETVAQPEPRKRGRKRKKTTEAPVEDEEMAHDEEAVVTDAVVKSPQTSSRTALSEKNTNPQPPSQPVAKEDCDQSTTSPSPQKQITPSTPAQAPSQSPSPTKGPTQHSPINPPGGATSKYRIGLSKRAPIPSLLKMVRKDRPLLAPPRNNTKKKKGKDVEGEMVGETEKQKELDVDHDDDDDNDNERSKRPTRDPSTGMLIEYEF